MIHERTILVMVNKNFNALHNTYQIFIPSCPPSVVSENYLKIISKKTK